MYFFLKYIVTLFYKKLRIRIVVCLLRESGPWCGILNSRSGMTYTIQSVVYCTLIA